MVHAFSNVASTLRAGAGAPKHISDIKGRIVMNVEGVGVNENIAGTLDANYFKGCGVRGGTERTAVCVGNGQLNITKPAATARTLNCMHDQQCVMENKTVRRLTPIECERLQGWPDGYTDVLLNGKPASDSARYKALGNGMAQPCPRWIIQRIVELTKMEKGN